MARVGLTYTDMAPSSYRPKSFALTPEWGMMRQLAMPHLDSLNKETGWTVSLGGLDVTQVLLLSRAPSTHDDQETHCRRILPGARLPAYCTSIGKVLLAYLPERELAAWFDAVDLFAFSDRTITGRAALRDRFVRIARSGISDCDGEFHLGEVSIARPVGPGEGLPVAAVMVSVADAMSLEALHTQCDAPLLFAAQQISEDWEQPDETALLRAEAEAEQEQEHEAEP